MLTERLRSVSARIPTRVRRTASIALAVVCAILLLLAIFPWGVLARHAARPISGAIGRTVSIGSAHRVDWFSLTPRIELTDVRVSQPSWIGAGTMAKIREARVTVPVLPLLVGRFRPRELALDGLTLALVRNEDGRASWDGGKKREGGHGAPPLVALAIRNGTVSLDDRRRHVRVAGTIAADARGLAVWLSGTLRDRPLRLTARGAPIGPADAGRPYPLRVVATSPLVEMDARAVMDRPLDTAAFSAHVRARGTDLTHLDDLVQAGLFPTQDFVLAGDVRHDGTSWRISKFAAHVGRSHLTATATVDRRGERTVIDATVDADAFGFDDFESDAQHARGEARAETTGDRIIPGTRIELDGLRRLDGVVRLNAKRLLVPAGSPFRALRTTARIDNRLLVLDPLDVRLVTGRATGRIVDDDRGDAPQLTLDLRLSDATVEGLITKSGSIQGPLLGQAHLRGRGATMREAIGVSDGMIGIAVPHGTTRRDYATFAGGDVGKSIGAAVDGSSPRVSLRCLVGRFVAKDGKLTPAPLVIDTGVSRADGQGSIDLATERLDLRMIGNSKQPGLLRSAAPTRITGTLSHPSLDITPPRAQDNAATGTISRIGHFLKGLKVRVDPSKRSVAADADCARLIQAAVGRAR